MKPERITLLLITFAILSYAPPISAGSGVGLSTGSTVYVPVYSHIYAGPRSRAINLSVTFSVRNTDPEHGISIESVQYHRSDGTPVKSYLTNPLVLAPLAAIRFIVKEEDTSGGSGASFIVKWKADTPVSVPIMQAVMISTRSQLGISFVTRGQTIR